MKKEEYSNILKIFQKSYNSVINKDVRALREFSNMTIHTASISQDEEAISVAVLMYSLSKIFERNYYEYKDWDKFYSNLKDNLKKIIQALKEKNIEEYKIYIKNILLNVDKLDMKLRNYIKEVFESARIHKASRIHEHGISVGKTAELLGITEWELMDYIGDTGIADVSLSQTMFMKDRLKIAKEIFK